MSSIKLKHASGNAVSIAAPESNPASDRTLYVPSNANGTILTNTTPGCVLQVVQTVKTDTSSSTSTSMADIPGLSLSITPSSSSNKILLLASVNSSNGGSNAVNFNWVRGSTTIAQNDTTGTNPASFTMYSSGSITIQDTISHQFLDSPNTTSATTYKIQWGAYTTGTRVINMYQGGTFYHGVSTITAMEIAV